MSLRARGQTSKLNVLTSPPRRSCNGLAPLPRTSSQASKSYFDPAAGGRRIYYGWALVPPSSTQTLARVTEFHAGLNILTFNPLPELAALRAAPALFSSPALTVAAGDSLWLGDWAPGVGNRSEFGATFAFPTSGAAVTFGVSVGAGVASGGANISTSVQISFDPVTFAANVSVGGQAGGHLSYYMPGVDLPGVSGGRKF